MGWFWRTAVVVGLLSAVCPWLLDYVTRREYPVPAPGTAVLITGSSTGIGHDAAVYLCQHGGYRVYAGVRKAQDAQAIKDLHIDGLVPVIIDVTDPTTIDSAYDTIVNDLEQRSTVFTGLVNNAGIGVGSELMEFVDMDKVQYLFDVNVFGVIRTTKKFLPLLRRSQGRIINISSMAGFMTSHHFGPYSGTKHALEAISDALRLELQAFNASVSVVQPGMVKTAIFAKGQAARANTDPLANQVYPHLKSPDMDPDKVEMWTTDVTNDAIFHAFTSPYPKTRYPVAGSQGVPTSVYKFLVWALPTRLLDKILMSVIPVKD